MPLILVLALCCLLPGAAHAEPPAWGFAVEGARVIAAERGWLLEADLNYRLSPAAVEALESGVALTIEVEVEVTRERSWLWGERVVDRVLRYRLQFQPLTEQYLVTHLESGAETRYTSSAQALEALGSLRGLALLGREALSPSQRYRGRLRALLDLEELPAPLRLVAYFSPAWGLRSEWYRWSLSF